MKPPTRAIRGASCFLLAWGAFSCLPADTRPPPATVLVEVSPNDASQKGVTTVDGWSISIDKFFVGIGDASAGDDCIKYSDAGYSRLIDATRSDDQKLSVLFALGQCDMDFRFSQPADDMLLGTGVTEADAILLATKATDPYVMQPAGASVDLTATATRGASTEHLHWSFRQRIRFENCKAPVDGKPTTPLDFPSNANLTYHIALMPEALFRDDVITEKASLRFDTIAAADTMFGNADGDVTLEELGKVSLDVARQAGPYGIVPINLNPDAMMVDPTTIHTLEDYVYLVLLRTIPQFREPILCEPNIRKRFD